MSTASRKKKKEKRIRIPAEYTESALHFKTGPGWKACYDSERELYTAETFEAGYYDLYEINEEIFSKLKTKGMERKEAHGLINTGRHLYKSVSDRNSSYDIALDKEYMSLCPWADVQKTGEMWESELTDLAVAIFESEKQNREQRMKTLIFNGSPRVAGDTVSLIDRLTGLLDGEYKVVDAYRSNISPCMDCRYCWKKPGCAIKDEMQEVYRYIEDCDNIVIASPIYFSELTGKMLDVGSRLQTYFCSRFFRKEEVSIKPKKGAVILVGGGDGHIDKPYETACTLMHHMNCHNIHEVVCSFNTNKVPAIEDKKAAEGIEQIAKFLNSKEYEVFKR